MYCLYSWIFVIITTILTLTRANNSTECDKALDIVILVDDPETKDEIKNVIKTTIDNYWNSNSRFSLFTYGCRKNDALKAFSFQLNSSVEFSNKQFIHQQVDNISCQRTSHKNKNKVNDAIDLVANLPLIKGLKRVLIIINRSDPSSTQLEKAPQLKNNAELIVFTNLESSRNKFHLIVNEDDLVSVYNTTEDLSKLIKRFQFVICNSIDQRLQDIVVNENQGPIDVSILFYKAKESDFNQVVRNALKTVMKCLWKKSFPIKFTFVLFNENSPICLLLLKNETNERENSLESFDSLKCEERNSMGTLTNAMQEINWTRSENVSHLIFVMNYIPGGNINDAIEIDKESSINFMNLQWKMKNYEGKKEENVNFVTVRNAVEYADEIINLFNLFFQGKSTTDFVHSTSLASNYDSDEDVDIGGSTETSTPSAILQTYSFPESSTTSNSKSLLSRKNMKDSVEPPSKASLNQHAIILCSIVLFIATLILITFFGLKKKFSSHTNSTKKGEPETEVKNSNKDHEADESVTELTRFTHT